MSSEIQQFTVLQRLDPIAAQIVRNHRTDSEVQALIRELHHDPVTLSFALQEWESERGGKEKEEGEFRSYYPPPTKHVMKPRAANQKQQNMSSLYPTTTNYSQLQTKTATSARQPFSQRDSDILVDGQGLSRAGYISSPVQLLHVQASNSPEIELQRIPQDQEVVIDDDPTLSPPRRGGSLFATSSSPSHHQRQSPRPMRPPDASGMLQSDVEVSDSDEEEQSPVPYLETKGRKPSEGRMVYHPPETAAEMRNIYTTERKPPLQWTNTQLFDKQQAQHQQQMVVPKMYSKPSILKQSDYNFLQIEVIALALRGKNVISVSGRHSGRCTCVSTICEAVIDYSTPLGRAPQMVIMCSVQEAPKLRQLLAIPIAQDRAVVITDLEYREKFSIPDLFRPQKNKYVGRRNQDAYYDAISTIPYICGEDAPVPLFLVVPNREYFDYSCIVDALSHFEDQPQLLVLADEPSNDLNVLMAELHRTFEHPAFFSQITCRSVLRDVVNTTCGESNIGIPLPEHQKYNGLMKIFRLLFDYKRFLVISATKRKSERLADACGRVMTSVSAHFRAPHTVTSAQDFLAKSIEEERQQKQQMMTMKVPSGNVVLQMATQLQRLCICCDFTTVPLLEGVSTHFDGVIYYDVPLARVSLMEPYSSKYFSRGGLGMGGGDRKMSPEAARVFGNASPEREDDVERILTLALMDGSEELASVKMKSGLRWVIVDL